MSICGTISSNILYNCDNPLTMGVADTAMFVNIDDIDKEATTFNATNPLVIEQLVLKQGKQAFKVEGHNFSNKHNTELVKGTYGRMWEHNFNFLVFDNTPEVKKWVNDAIEARFVIIHQNMYNRQVGDNKGNTVYEILGYNLGLEIKVATRDTEDEESMGGWVIEAGCHERIKESNMPYTFYNTDLATTKAAIDALLTPAT